MDNYQQNFQRRDMRRRSNQIQPVNETTAGSDAGFDTDAIDSMNTRNSNMVQNRKNMYEVDGAYNTMMSRASFSRSQRMPQTKMDDNNFRSAMPYNRKKMEEMPCGCQDKMPEQERKIPMNTPMNMPMNKPMIKPIQERTCAAGEVCRMEGCALAMAYIPDQEFREVFEDLTHALMVGTIFSELDKPFLMGGCSKK